MKFKIRTHWHDRPSLKVVKLGLGDPLTPGELKNIVDRHKTVVLPEGPVIEPGPLPVEPQVLLRVMGEDLETAKELIKAMRPVDRAILIFYTREIELIVNEINQAEGRY